MQRFQAFPDSPTTKAKNNNNDRACRSSHSASKAATKSANASPSAPLERMNRLLKPKLTRTREQKTAGASHYKALSWMERHWVRAHDARQVTSYHIIPYARSLVGPLRSLICHLLQCWFRFFRHRRPIYFLLLSITFSSFFSITCQARIISKNILLYRKNYLVNIKEYVILETETVLVYFYFN